MKGRKENGAEPYLGLCVLNSKEWRQTLPPPNTFDVMSVFMGISRQAVEQETRRVCRKFRIRWTERYGKPDPIELIAIFGGGNVYAYPIRARKMNRLNSA
jgi:hypothetical protein